MASYSRLSTILRLISTPSFDIMVFTATTVLGLVAATCTTIAFIPQALKTIKTRNTKDLSLSTYVLLVVGIILWLIYGFLMQDLPVIIANAVTFFFIFTIMVLKIKHK